MNPTPAPVLKTGIVKLVQSGDSFIIRKQPKGGPPPEKLLSLAGITAPKLARQRAPNSDMPDSKDEPYAWEAREFLRSRLIGREVVFTSEKPPNSANREFGTVWAGKDPNKNENIAEALVAEGLARVREGARNAPQLKKLVDLEEVAKAHGKGIWGADLQDHVRDVKFTVENPKAFVNKHNGKPIKAVIEYVRDGSTVRVLLLPEFYQITLMIAGIRCPVTSRPDGGESEPFADEAKFFVESALLQRDVEIILQSVNNNNFVGTILHPHGNIAEVLLRQGFARCVDWSMAVMKPGTAVGLRAAENYAKDLRMRIWRNYTNSAPHISAKDKEFQATVMEVVNGDALNVKLPNNMYKKIFLSSIRPPRESASTEEGKISLRPKNFKPLYDIPWMYEAREFLRKKLIGKKVTITVDYIQPARDNFPEKTCCTVTICGANVAEALVLKGLATVVRYSKDNDQRSVSYDHLMEAEVKALKSGVGIYDKKNVPAHRIQDTSGDAAKAKKFFHFLKRLGRTEATVEFVISGSRMRVYIPKEQVIVTFLLAGIKCPRGARPAIGNAPPQVAEPYGEEALQFTKEKCLQRDVVIMVEEIDKAGNFYGWLWIDNENLSVSLVQVGLSSMHHTAESTDYARPLKNAEEHAKMNKLGVWKNFVEVEPEEKFIESVPQDRKVQYVKVLPTLITQEGHFYAQQVESGPKLEALMEAIAREVTANPPLPGSYKFRRGEVVAARFQFDNNWYRAKVERVLDQNVQVLYIDYGNRETLNISRCAALPSGLASDPAYAVEYALAGVKFPSDNDDKTLAMRSLGEDILNKEMNMNIEIRGSPPLVTLVEPKSGDDIGKGLIADGLLLVDNTRDRRLAKMMDEYRATQEQAKKQRLNLWQHGDITEDDAKEFGMN